MSDDAPNTDERRGTGDYRGPERRRCERGQYCTNVAEAKAETRVLEEKVDQQYKALHTRLDEVSERLKDLPKEIADQITADRKAVDKNLDRGSEDFKEIFRRLAKVEKAIVALYILLGVVMVGKGFAWLWATFAHG